MIKFTIATSEDILLTLVWEEITPASLVIRISLWICELLLLDSEIWVNSTISQMVWVHCLWKLWSRLDFTTVLTGRNTCGTWRIKNPKTDGTNTIMNILEGTLDFHTMWEPEFKLIHVTFLEAKRLLLTYVLLCPRIWEVTFPLGSGICIIPGLSFLINFVNSSRTLRTWILSSLFQSFYGISLNY